MFFLATPSVNGQVVGGRWKPLHYVLRNSIFADQLVACANGTCYIKNDATVSFKGTMTINAVHFADGSVVSVFFPSYAHSFLIHISSRP